VKEKGRAGIGAVASVASLYILKRENAGALRPFALVHDWSLPRRRLTSVSNMKDIDKRRWISSIVYKVCPRHC